MANLASSVLGTAAAAALAMAATAAAADPAPATGSASAAAAITTAPVGTDPLALTLTANDGSPYPLAQHRGKVVLFVNTASKCGLTPQYTALQALHQQYAAQGLVVIGCPANDFGKQEPGSNEDILQFCSTKYQVTFPLMSKMVVTGKDIHPLYQILTTQANPPGPVKWNFGKFLIGRDGAIAARFEPKVKPDDQAVITAVTTALAAKVP